jgi:hypothetical protein
MLPEVGITNCLKVVIKLKILASHDLEESVDLSRKWGSIA